MNTKLTTAICAALTAIALPATAEKKPEPTSGVAAPDLTAEVKFWNGRVGVFAGIRNLFDEDYWGEVRKEGIMLALPRNYYGGFEVFF